MRMFHKNQTNGIFRQCLTALAAIAATLTTACSTEDENKRQTTDTAEIALDMDASGIQLADTTPTEAQFDILCDGYQIRDVKTGSAVIPIQSKNCQVVLDEFTINGSRYINVSTAPSTEGSIVTYSDGTQQLFIKVAKQLPAALASSNMVSFLLGTALQGGDLAVAAASMSSASVVVQVGNEPAPRVEIAKAEMTADDRLQIELRCLDSLSGSTNANLKCSSFTVSIDLQYAIADFPAQAEAAFLGNLFKQQGQAIGNTLQSFNLQQGYMTIKLPMGIDAETPQVFALKLKTGVSMVFAKLSATPDEEPGEEPPTTPPTNPGGPVIDFGIGGIWLSAAQMEKLPASGKAFDEVKAAAMSSWGTANLSDNNSSHDVKTLAGAIYAAKTKDAAMRNKVIEGLKSAMSSKLARALELSRGLQTYIIAADLIGYGDAAFKAFVKDVVYKDIQGHSGGKGLFGTAVKSPSNWGGHARASLAAAGVYLKDQAMIDAVVKAHKEFIGETVSGPQSVYTSTGWHFDPNKKAGINRANAGIFSGVLPEDWRRDGSLDPKSVKSIEDMKKLSTGYAWEGMQGAVVTAVILHRAGLISISAGENAIARAMDRLYSIGNLPSSDDTWVPFVMNYYTGKNYSGGGSTVGKGMGYTNYTHVR